jgi:hypothetical protein
VTERNAPCPCGSGKKYKKCCLLAAPSGPPCKFREPGLDHGCGAPSTGTMVCKFCRQALACCAEHKTSVSYLLEDHVLRRHPEHIPEVIDALIASPEHLANFRTEVSKLDPSMWTHVWEVFERRRAETAN